MSVFPGQHLIYLYKETNTNGETWTQKSLFPKIRLCKANTAGNKWQTENIRAKNVKTNLKQREKSLCKYLQTVLFVRPFDWKRRESKSDFDLSKTPPVFSAEREQTFGGIQLLSADFARDCLPSFSSSAGVALNPASEAKPPRTPAHWQERGEKKIF